MNTKEYKKIVNLFSDIMNLELALLGKSEKEESSFYNKVIKRMIDSKKKIRI